MFPKNALQKKFAQEKFRVICPYVIIFGMKIGNVPSAVKEIVVITM